MALTDESGNSMVMPVAPMGGYGNGGFGGFGNGDLSWLIILLLCGWGGGFGFGGGFGGMAMADGLGLYPWLNNSQNVNDGFREQMLNSNVNSIRDGINGIGIQLCGGFADVNSNICNGFSQAEIAANSRQMADMNQRFGIQTSMLQGFNGTGTQIADLKYVLAQEACATRNASAMNTRDIIESGNRNSQAILDKLCALELDGVKSQLAAAQRENVGLQNQLNMASFRESQAAQNTFIAQGLSDEVDALYNRLKNCPVGTTPVYGNTPIFTCNSNNSGCGCSGNSFFN